LKHQVETEKVLRDQFKSFVKTNMDVFDFEADNKEGLSTFSDYSSIVPDTISHQNLFKQPVKR
jgi:hypothetical protein